MKMNRILRLATTFVVVSLGTSVLAANFTPGNLVIYRKGDGTSALTNCGNPVFLDEYTTDAVTHVQAVMLRTNYFGANSPLLANGTEFADGLITRSVDGRFILVNGYGATLGQFTNLSIQARDAIEVPRIVGLVDQFLNQDTTTAQTNSRANAEGFRSATSTDGTNLWFAGSVGGIRYAPRGSNDSTQLSTFITNMRQVNIFSNVLYFSDASGSAIRIGTVTNDMPVTTTNAFYQTLSGFSTNTGTPLAFALFKLTGGADDFDTLYVADSTTNGVMKWSLVGGNWVNDGSISAFGADGLIGQTRVVGGTTNVDLWITGGGGTLLGGDNLYQWTDSTGYHADPGPASANILLTSPGGESFGGLAFTPVGGETFPSGAARISVGPALGFFSTGLTGCLDPSTQLYSVADPGTASVNWSATCDQNWVTLTPASGLLGSGGSVTVTASFNANVTALATGTNTATITFANTDTHVGDTTRQVREILTPVNILPSTDLITTGPIGGPFTVTNKTYTLTNGATAFNYTISHSPSVNWLTLSTPTNGLLGGCAGVAVTVSLNANANTLGAGIFSDVISFSNKDANTLIDTRNVSLTTGQVFWFDDFSTFIQNNDLLGQKAWTLNNSGSVGGSTFQVSNNAVVYPGGQTLTGQWLFKNFPTTTNPAVFAGLLMTINSVASTQNQYLATMFQFNSGTLGTPAGFTLYELGFRGTDAGFTNFVVAGRYSQQGNTPYFPGTTTFPVGSQLRVIYKSDVNASNMVVYVNPTSTNLAAQTIYVTAANTNSFIADPGVGSFGLRLFGTSTIASPGANLYRLAVSTNYADVYNFITLPFAVTSITRSGNNMVINWNGQPGSNIVQVATSPNNYSGAGTFVNVGSVVLTNFTPATFTDVGGATNKPNRYYRVKGSL